VAPNRRRSRRPTPRERSVQRAHRRLLHRARRDLADALDQQTFSVSSGQTTAALTLNAIPTGSVLFSGLAFDVPCGFVVLTTEPTWVADSLTLQVSPGRPLRAAQLHARTTAIVGVNFGGDAYTVTTIAGLGGAPGSADGVGAAARFAGPNSAALSADGTKLFVGDRNDGNIAALGMAIRQVDLATGAVSTIAGSLSALGTADGPGVNARFSRLFSVVVSGQPDHRDRCAIRSMSTTPPFNVTTLVGTRQAANPTSGTAGYVTPLAFKSWISPCGDRRLCGRLHPLRGVEVALASTPPVISLVAGVPDSPGRMTARSPMPTWPGERPGLPFVGDDVFYLVDTDLFVGYGSSGGISLLEDSVITVAGAPQTGFVSTDGWDAGTVRQPGAR